MYLFLCGSPGSYGHYLMEASKCRGNAGIVHEFPVSMCIQCYGLSAAYLALYLTCVCFPVDALEHDTHC